MVSLCAVYSWDHRALLYLLVVTLIDSSSDRLLGDDISNT